MCHYSYKCILDLQKQCCRALSCISLPKLLRFSINIRHEVLCRAATVAILPFAAISDATDLVVEPDRAALRYPSCSAAVEAFLEHVNAQRAVLVYAAIVELLHRDAVLESAVLD